MSGPGNWEARITALEAENAALRKQVEAATALLDSFVAMLPRSLDLGRLPFGELHDKAAKFVRGPGKGMVR